MKKIFYLLIFLTITVSDVIAEESDLPKGPLGKPDLNGVWQVLNSANFNLEAHAASASLAMVEGPIGKSDSSAITSETVIVKNIKR